ncbi:interleukin-1 receptor-associated kinase 1-binding protein 1 isoform X1 [Chelonoidis abingdonii]|uniref:interleukin-1 receptor-associated kinase 1-binding protein 1 isoform X1 n=1 Tax=Chelonoidis abingdonii TaxID=106734 RepID=UPI0013F1B7C9|nr:interleukin-1 receptor-associated kinase 1-binding protein 1 isoform X1 [Chelonoidis abingdonii]
MPGRPHCLLDTGVYVASSEPSQPSSPPLFIPQFFSNDEYGDKDVLHSPQHSSPVNALITPAHLYKARATSWTLRTNPGMGILGCHLCPSLQSTHFRARGQHTYHNNNNTDLPAHPEQAHIIHPYQQHRDHLNLENGGEEEEEFFDKDNPPEAHFSSSLPDDTIMPLPPNTGDGLKQLQDLYKRVVSSLDISLKEVQEAQYKLIDILHTSTSSKIALPTNDVIMEPVKLFWQTPATIPPTCKRSDKNYCVPTKGTEFLFSHPMPNSLVIDVVNEWGRQEYPETCPMTKIGSSSTFLAAKHTPL